MFYAPACLKPIITKPFFFQLRHVNDEGHNGHPTSDIVKRSHTGRRVRGRGTVHATPDHQSAARTDRREASIIGQTARARRETQADYVA